MNLACEEIFKTSFVDNESIIYAYNITNILVWKCIGDLLQLPLFKSPKMFEAYNNEFGELFNLWLLCLMAELKEVMRQR